MNPSYPIELLTIGDHLRKARLDRGMSQSEVAKLLKVQINSVTGWELGWHQPTPKMAARIIEFIGIIPFKIKYGSLGKKLYYTRLIKGMTQKQVANYLGCDETNLRQIEHDLRKPKNIIHFKVQKFIESAITSFN